MPLGGSSVVHGVRDAPGAHSTFTARITSPGAGDRHARSAWFWRVLRRGSGMVERPELRSRRSRVPLCSV